MNHLLKLSKVSTALFAGVVAVSILNKFDIHGFALVVLLIPLYVLPHLFLCLFISKQSNRAVAIVAVIIQFIIGVLCAIPLVDMVFAIADSMDGLALMILGLVQFFAIVFLWIVIMAITRIRWTKR